MNFAFSVTNWGVCEELHSMQMPILILEWYMYIQLTYYTLISV